ncbi:unnamed protein product [Gongylonema pulchrum]|uniref:Uncharacterized protein n=1 Tax=Gongylonema pulchrum TaxID=637853 RepID=A0A183DDY9_9BILA|nr:unnamed protein product [Gongylonema pulchrum]
MNDFWLPKSNNKDANHLLFLSRGFLIAIILFIRTESTGIKNDSERLENRASQIEVRLEDTVRAIEANERAQRSLSLRVYGFDYTRCKIPRADDQDNFDVISAADLLRKLMVEG